MELQRKRILLQCRLSAGRKLNNTRMQSVAEGSSSVATGEPPRLPISGNCRCAMACVLITLAMMLIFPSAFAGGFEVPVNDLPREIETYDDAGIQGVANIVLHRAGQEPLNLIASVIFVLAIIHTFMAGKFLAMSEQRREFHQLRVLSGKARLHSIDIVAEAAYFFGTVEVIFGLWVVPLFFSIIYFYDWSAVVHYLEYGVNLTDAAFVAVIMLLASTRPILNLAESFMEWVADLLGGSLAAIWFTILTLGPTLGSLITEPAAITISALLLSRKVYAVEPGERFKYATLALLFVNVSVGGTLTNFAAPPVLVVAGPWGWDTSYTLATIGWKAIVGIVIANAAYYAVFRREFARLQDAYALRCLRETIERRIVTRELVNFEWQAVEQELHEREHLDQEIRRTIDDYVARVRARMEEEYLPQLQEGDIDSDLVKEAFEKRFDEIRLEKLRQSAPAFLPRDERVEYLDPTWDEREEPVPVWVTLVHVLFMVWTIMNSEHAALFVLGALFFLGFASATAPYQNRIKLQSPLLVGFFLAGLLIHGGMQGWWIQPVLSSLSETALMAAATVLTAFNDNTAITYLSTLVPEFSDGMRYAAVTGAVAGGGLTIIANAPNPAGQSILKKHFGNAVSPTSLFLAAVMPTAIVWLCFYLL